MSTARTGSAWIDWNLPGLRGHVHRSRRNPAPRKAHTAPAMNAADPRLFSVPPRQPQPSLAAVRAQVPGLQTAAAPRGQGLGPQPDAPAPLSRTWPGTAGRPVPRRPPRLPGSARPSLSSFHGPMIGRNILVRITVMRDRRPAKAGSGEKFFARRLCAPAGDGRGSPPSPSTPRWNLLIMLAAQDLRPLSWRQKTAASIWSRN